MAEYLNDTTTIPKHIQFFAFWLAVIVVIIFFILWVVSYACRRNEGGSAGCGSLCWIIIGIILLIIVLYVLWVLCSEYYLLTAWGFLLAVMLFLVLCMHCKKQHNTVNEFVVL